MTRKFKRGDRVKIKPTSLWLSCSLTYGVDYVGTVIDCVSDVSILVKFDNFTDGFNGSVFYRKKGINYDPKNQQHLYVGEDDLCLLEERNI